MILPEIDRHIRKLITEHETRNPYKIAKNLGIIVIEEELGEVYGYYNKVNRIKMLHINSELNNKRQLYICGHELGHAICHPDEITPQLSNASITSELKIEKEADYFATNLLINDEYKELYNPTKYEILNYYGLPHRLERYVNL